MPVTVSFRQIRTGGALTIPIVYFLTVTRLSGRTIFLQDVEDGFPSSNWSEGQRNLALLCYADRNSWPCRLDRL